MLVLAMVIAIAMDLLPMSVPHSRAPCSLPVPIYLTFNGARCADIITGTVVGIDIGVFVGFICGDDANNYFISGGDAEDFHFRR